MSLEETKGIKFPDKHYVGFQQRNKEGINLGFMTPYGTDAQAKKRMATVDTWANNRYGGTYNYTTRQYENVPDAIPAVIYDNAPMTGFKVSHTVNHGSSWASCNDKWRILDPRGFELEITSGNFERVLEFTDVLKGEIQGECIWARLGANNVLIPVATDIYRNAMNNTVRDKSKVSLKELCPGYKATLKNGDVGIYMGLFHVVHSSNYGEKSVFNHTISAKKRHVFMKEDKSGFFYYATPILSFVEDSEEITNGFAIVNSLLASDPKIKLRGSQDNGIAVCSNTDIKFKLVELKNQTTATVKESGHLYGYVDYDETNLAQFYLDGGYYNHNRLSANVVNPNLTYATVFKLHARYKYNYWNNHSPEYTSSFELPAKPEKFSVYYAQFSDAGQSYKFPI